MKLTVGQTLWYVPSGRHGNPHEITVEKVGRKWATCSRFLRIDMETLAADGGNYSSPGSCYLSKADHDAEVALEETWKRFRDLVDRQWHCPEGVRISQMENAARALFKTSVQPPTTSEKQP